MTLQIPLPQPFNVELSLARLRLSSYGAPYHFPTERTAQRLLPIDGRLEPVEFDIDGDTLKLSVLSGSQQSSTGGEDLAALASHLWGLEDDLHACYEVLGADQLFAPLIERYYGLRTARVPDLYEALLVAVLGQQISVQAASAIRKRLMLALGERLEVGGHEYHAYPAPQRLLAAGIEGLREAGISRQKGGYLLAIAEKAAAGELERSSFNALPDEEAIARLTRIRGVGRWTAEVALIRGLGRPDVFPAADLGLMVAAQRLAELPSRPTERELRALAERWGGWRSYAAVYLWATLYDGY